MSDNKTLCPLRFLTKTFGGKWKMPIICILADNKPKRYSVIRRRLGNVTNIMLTKSLRELEAAGLISRTQYDETPPRVEYALTLKGSGVLPMLTTAAEWAVKEMGFEGINAYCSECTDMI
ncbi:MAG: helix-turn-helix transcriptional regulator [Synergistaceae bacterium]|nr:helix-turn-helix transcriptional regulator [Synergistaceae bacterium]